MPLLLASLNHNEVAAIPVRLGCPVVRLAEPVVLVVDPAAGQVDSEEHREALADSAAHRAVREGSAEREEQAARVVRADKRQARSSR